MATNQSNTDYIAENNNRNIKKGKEKNKLNSIKPVLVSCVFKALKYVVYRNAFDFFPVD